MHYVRNWNFSKTILKRNSSYVGTMLGPPVFNNLFKPQTAIFVTYHSLVSIIMEEQIQYSSMADFI